MRAFQQRLGKSAGTRNGKARVAVVVALVLLVALGVGWRLFAGRYRIALLAPSDRALVSGSFRVDVALAGTRRPDAIEVLLGDRVVARAEIPKDRWSEPGSAMVTDVTADVRDLEPGWYTMTARVTGGPLSSVETSEVKLLVARGTPLKPADAAEITLAHEVLATSLPRALLKLDEARRLDRDDWQQDGVYKRAREEAVREGLPDDVRGALQELFDAVERNEDSEALTAGDTLNLLFERRRFPLFVTINGSSWTDGRKELHVLTYALEKPVSLRLKGEDLEGLTARRLDTLNIRELMLGHRSTGAARAVLLVDRIEEEATKIARCLGEPTETCRDRWSGVRLDYAVPDDVLDGALEAMAAEIREATGAACAEDGEPCERAVADLLRTSVAHHEVRHVADDRHGLPFARGLLRTLDRLRKSYKLRDDRNLKMRVELEEASYNTVAGANQETSAYLAELAEVPGMRLYNLSEVHAFAIDGRYDGTDEAWAGRTILAALAAEAGLDDLSLIDAIADDVRWGQALSGLVKLGPDAVGRLAADAYTAEFGSYDRAVAR